MMDNGNPAAEALRLQKKAAPKAQRKAMLKQYSSALCGFFVQARKDPTLVIMGGLQKSISLNGCGSLILAANIDVANVCVQSIAFPFRFICDRAWQKKLLRDQGLAERRNEANAPRQSGPTRGNAAAMNMQPVLSAGQALDVFDPGSIDCQDVLPTLRSKLLQRKRRRGD